MGLIGAEIDIATVNTAILNHTLQQFLFIGLIFVCGLLIMMVIFNRLIIKKITRLEANVDDYSKTKDVYVAQEIRKNIRGRDEVSSLSEGIAKMMEDIKEYVDSLSAVNQELDVAQANAAKLSELAMKDGLTGIRNRTAYKQEMDRLDNSSALDCIEYAIAVIDMNNLKKFNDVYGHDKGNAAIIKLTNLICVTFKHSAVFRIGGDEFVAILRNDDFINREKLTAEMYRAFDEMEQDTSLSPWEKISAAIGLAVYDRTTDVCADDVFKRADEKMYEKKNTMKSRDK
ncbi:MAG: GGDEF domain-containing protein [Clostridia bacterium]|nr:GGDEF domain-containing protein [Clostridia bacterium]